MAYGKVKKIFTLKQLLFIGNENNDNLDIHEYRNKFIQISNEENNLDELFKSFNNNNILGELVNKIYTLLKKELGLNFNNELKNIIVSKDDDAKEADINEIIDIEEIKGIDKKDDDKKKSLNEFELLGEQFFIRDDDHYDCHIKGTYFCGGKMFAGDDN